VIVATEHDSVYAFDAAGQPEAPLWKVSFVDAQKGVTTVPGREQGCTFIQPESGITSTPAIDLESGTIYVLARTKEDPGMFRNNRYVQKLHALALTTGAEKFGGPVEIKTPGFNPLREFPRAALLLANGNVVIAWGSSCDVGPYHGWVMSYDARTLAQKAVFNTSPAGMESGIWQSDMGPAADEDGNIYVATGNGKFTAASGGQDYGDSLLKFDASLKLLDFFTPFNEHELNAEDADLGSGGPVVLPKQAGPHPRQVLIAGKGGELYSVDRDQMGKYRAGEDSHAVQRIHLRGGEYAAPAVWNGHVFVLSNKGVVTDYSLDNGRLALHKEGVEHFHGSGSTPVVSSNGKRDGIVWLLESKAWNSPDRPAVLHAYDAADVSRTLYDSGAVPARDQAGNTLRFTLPTVADGRVYVPTVRNVYVYALLSAR